jgi:hypothetical protein
VGEERHVLNVANVSLPIASSSCLPWRAGVARFLAAAGSKLALEHNS